MLQGSLVALVTPMHPDGSLDMEALKALIDWHIAEGTDGIVAVGTTGESATLSVDEHCSVLRECVRHAAGRIPIIAGTGANSTAEAIELTQYAREIGAQAALSVVPYYNKPTQEGIYQHFRRVAETVDLPLIVYNVPGRTVADASNETVVRLAQVPGIVGIKDATADIGRGSDLLARVPPSFAVYSGDDLSAIALMLLGGRGTISVTANVAPRAMHALCVAAVAGDVATARRWHELLIPLHKGLFLEPNPIPVKWALSETGRIQTGLRLPLVALSASYHEGVRAALRHAQAL